MKDYVKEVAQALSQGKPITTLCKNLLAEIEAERSRLMQQQVMIKQFATMYPDPARKPGGNSKGGSMTGTTVSMPRIGEVMPEPNGHSGLTDTQRAKFMELAVQLVRERGWRKKIPSQDFIDLLAAHGERLDVGHPPSVAGSFLFRAQKRLEREEKERSRQKAGEFVSSLKKGAG